MAGYISLNPKEGWKRQLASSPIHNAVSMPRDSWTVEFSELEAQRASRFAALGTKAAVPEGDLPTSQWTAASCWELTGDIFAQYDRKATIRSSCRAILLCGPCPKPGAKFMAESGDRRPAGGGNRGSDARKNDEVRQ